MIFRNTGRLKRLGLLLTVLGALATIPVIGALAYEPDATDPARNLALPCGELSTPGGLHFWALGRINGVPASRGASPTTPKRLGAYFNPNPNRAPDPLGVAIAGLPRAERGCTVHVFRIGGNGTAGPGESAAGFGGVSTLPARQLPTAWYGGSVWRVDFSGPPSSGDGIAEDSRTTWGNTLGWNVMPGADTWSAKEYKGHVYAGDMLRGFDVYRLAG